MSEEKDVLRVLHGAEEFLLCPADFSTYEDVLKHLSINPETVLLIKDGKVVPHDAQPASGVLKLIGVVSGG